MIDRQPTLLRLELDPAELPRLQGLKQVKDVSVGRAVSRTLSSTYYDTPDRQLGGSGVIYEVRTRGRGYQQSVRADGVRLEDGTVHREWENPLPSPDPDPMAIADLDLRQLATPLPGTALEPAITITVKHTTRRLALPGGAEATLTIDAADIAAAGRKQKAVELQLACEEENPPLYDVALALAEEVPLRVATAGIEQKAFEILTGSEPSWRKAIRLELSADASVESVLCRILEHCLDHLKDNERCTLASDHPEGVHQMRVAMRRMRSALRIFRPVLPPEQYARVGDEVKWLTKSLADTRDLDVFMDEIVGPVAAAFPEEPAFTVMMARLAADRDAARAEARQAVGSPRYTRFLLETGAWMARQEWRNQPVNESSVLLFQPITALTDQLIAKRFKKVRKDGKRFAEMTVEQKHQLRIDVKRLRYAIDFFSSLYNPKRVKAFIGHLQKLQDGLGYMNDLAVAEGLIKRLIETADADSVEAIRHAGALVLGWHTHAGIEASKTLAEDVKELVSSRPFWTHEQPEEP